MTAKPNIALIGIGRIGEVHARTLARLGHLGAFAMIVDPREKLARDLADQLGVPKVATDPGAAFDDPDIDAVVIASPTDTHAPCISAAAAAGKDIFTEKPIALDLATTDEAIAAVERAGVRMQVGFQRHFDRGYQAAWEYIQAGGVGQIEMIHDAMRDPEPPSTDYLARSGGFWRDMVVHNFDCVRWLMGEEPVEVFALGSSLVSDEIRAIGDIDTSVVTLTFASGAIATIENSRRSGFGYDVRTEVFGSGGAIFVDDAQATPVRRFHREGVTEDHHWFFLNRFGDAYVAELESFVSAVAHDRDVAVTGADGRAALLLAYAAEMAFRDGRPVAVADVEARASAWPGLFEPPTGS
ncbi:MAG TPA: inositol 2-dehydrogenase [Thermomicrobiales bacterium]|nr:inositol 2-dehydrogenase [Thermomicrobiales bacterium]